MFGREGGREGHVKAMAKSFLISTYCKMKKNCSLKALVLKLGTLAKTLYFNLSYCF